MEGDYIREVGSSRCIYGPLIGYNYVSEKTVVCLIYSFKDILGILITTKLFFLSVVSKLDL